MESNLQSVQEKEKEKKGEGKEQRQRSKDGQEEAHTKGTRLKKNYRIRKTQEKVLKKENEEEEDVEVGEQEKVFEDKGVDDEYESQKDEKRNKEIKC